MNKGFMNKTILVLINILTMMSVSAAFAKDAVFKCKQPGSASGTALLVINPNGANIVGVALDRNKDYRYEDYGNFDNSGKYGVPPSNPNNSIDMTGGLDLDNNELAANSMDKDEAEVAAQLAAQMADNEAANASADAAEAAAAKTAKKYDRFFSSEGMEVLVPKKMTQQKTTKGKIIVNGYSGNFRLNCVKQK